MGTLVGVSLRHVVKHAPFSNNYLHFVRPRIGTNHIVTPTGRHQYVLCDRQQ